VSRYVVIFASGQTDAGITRSKVRRKIVEEEKFSEIRFSCVVFVAAFNPSFLTPPYCPHAQGTAKVS